MQVEHDTREWIRKIQHMQKEIENLKRDLLRKEKESPLRATTIKTSGGGGGNPAGVSNEYPDDEFTIVDNTDPTKKLVTQLSAITTATTRTWTVGDVDITFDQDIQQSASPTFVGLTIDTITSSGSEVDFSKNINMNANRIWFGSLIDLRYSSSKFKIGDGSNYFFQLTDQGTEGLFELTGDINLAGYLQYNNNEAVAITSQAHPVIYGTTGSASYPFNESGNLVISPRISGADRDVIIAGNREFVLVDKDDFTTKKFKVDIPTGDVTLTGNLTIPDNKVQTYGSGGSSDGQVSYQNTSNNWQFVAGGGVKRTRFVIGGAAPQTFDIYDNAVANKLFEVDNSGNGYHKGALEIDGDLNHDGSNIGFYATTPAAQSSAYTRNATVVESRTLLASASATTTNNNNVLAALIADLQSIGILG